MENASKALIMAGGVLIGMLIISVMIFVFRKAGQLSSEYDTQLSDSELVKFNSQFELYAKKDNTYFDVITVSNLAYSVNNQNGNDTSENNSVKIYIINKNNDSILCSILPDSSLKRNYFFKGGDVTTNQLYMYEEVANDGLMKNYGGNTTFSCKDEGSIKYNAVGKVCEMRFKIN